MDIKIWQEKIKQKVKKWTYRDFLQNIASLFPLNLYKYQDLITIYPPVFSSQIKVIDSSNQWNIDLITKNYDFGHNFFYNWEKFFYQNVYSSIFSFLKCSITASAIFESPSRLQWTSPGTNHFCSISWGFSTFMKSGKKFMKSMPLFLQKSRQKVTCIESRSFLRICILHGYTAMCSFIPCFSVSSWRRSICFSLSSRPCLPHLL